MKMLTNFKLLFACMVLLYATSCTTYYVPNSQEIPLFTAKNQGRANVGYTFFPEGTKAFKYSGSYSFSDHFGATANMFFVSESDNHSKNYHGTILKGTSVGLGLVHFLPVSKKHVFETTFGFAGGNARNGAITINNATIENKVSFINIFIQPSIGLVKKNFEMAISLKYNLHTFLDLNVSLVQEAKLHALNQQEYNGKTYYDYPINKTFHVLEPAITIRYGWEKVKLGLQIVPSFLLGNADFARENINASLGIHFKFGNNRLSTSMEY